MYLNTELATPPVTMPAAPFKTSGIYTEAIEDIIEYYRLRQDMVKARTKLILQAQASLRRHFDGDKEQAAATFAAASKDEEHEYYGAISPYLMSLKILDDQQGRYEKELVRAVKKLPVFEWVKSIKGLGDVSAACIIGECSGYHRETGEFYSLGDFKSVSAVWKRMGLAVIGGERQRRKAGDEALLHAYSPTRRSLMWNVGNSIILGMGKFRPLFGEVIDDNTEYTTLQKVFANRARYEAERLPHKTGEAIKESKTGKDSYTAHAANRAKRYTEKRLLRMMFAEWRRCMG
ncbi:hypothetical protein DEM27_31805 [Metarhizobium album]|uniref:IS110 family transposase n=1 Tax=Metarhizobium album TaxID=2182425 RepID=A0A2U2DG78_9HYPH|nr:hypothetical protein [Rhizobium album]PWE52326.1 hypothetical protein DEM27_31805 [Rhizobium album]